MLGLESIWHWLIVLAIVVLVFGTKKLKNVGQDLGSAVRGFKEGMKGDEPTATQAQQPTNTDSNARIIDHDPKP